MFCLKVAISKKKKNFFCRLLNAVKTNGDIRMDIESGGMAD
jgi:hypothetical protein